jgi:riboflavin synthase
VFTGIIEELGRVEAAGEGRLTISCRTVREGSDVGASLAVNGVCLTVTDRPRDGLSFDVSDETLSRTNLRRLRSDAGVNLERPVTLLTRLGGHLVQGHVDGVGTVTSVTRRGEGVELRVSLPEGLGRYVVEKGSVTVDGVSLTVTGTTDGTFGVELIPHTLDVTTLGAAEEGDAVNLEVDVIAKYVERLVEGRT